MDVLFVGFSVHITVLQVVGCRDCRSSRLVEIVLANVEKEKERAADWNRSRSKSSDDDNDAAPKYTEQDCCQSLKGKERTIEQRSFPELLGFSSF